MHDAAAFRAKALADRAEALVQADRLAEAEALYREAAALEATATRLHNIATIRMFLGDYAGAEAGLRQALALEPGHARARASLGLALLGQGRLAEGFTLYDVWRELPELAPGAAPKLAIPEWRGEPVAGKNLVIWAEEGFGDQIQFARFAPLLVEAGAQVAWLCDPAMVRLLREGLGMEAMAGRAGMKIVGADYIVPSTRLPAVFLQRLAAPPAAPYLARPKPAVIEGLRLGIVARGNPNHPNDRRRSLPDAAAAELMALPGAVSLAPQATGARDFWDTAAVIAGLDLVISVDTSVAHLAGALGKPCWVLLPAIACDWRWEQGRRDSRWYAGMRLFRQTTPGDWSGVLAEVRAALAGR